MRTIHKKNIKICTQTTLSSHILRKKRVWAPKMRVKGLTAHTHNKNTIELRRGKKEELRKRVEKKLLSRIYRTGSCVFGAVIFSSHHFFMGHFLFDNTHTHTHLLWFRCGCFFYLFIIVHWSCFDRGRMRTTSKLENLLVCFRFRLLSFYLNIERTKRKELCVFVFEIIHDQFIHCDMPKRWCHYMHSP